MTHFFQRIPVIGALGVGALALSVSACGQSPAEQEVDEQAEAIEQSYEAEADLMEAQAENAPNEELVEEQADALRAEGEQIEDRLKEMGDELDDVPE